MASTIRSGISARDVNCARTNGSSGLVRQRVWKQSRSGRSSRLAVSSAGVRFTGIGASVPKTVVTNDDLSKYVDTNDEWIATRTGIKQRHILADGEKLADYAADASRKALEMAGVAPEDLDMIIMATSSADDAFGSATQVQAQLGAKGCIAFDLTAACSGFVMATITGSQFIKTGSAKNILVIGADALSRYVDWRDRGTCILFGDGTGAMVMQASEDGTCNFLGSDMHSDGNGYCSLYADQVGNGNKLSSDNPSAPNSFNNLFMNGQEVFKFAVRTVPSTILASCKSAGIEKDQLDWVVCHQANQRILDAASSRLKIPEEKVYSNLASYGNTSAASIPIALAEAVEKDLVTKGQTVALAGFGAGLTYASAIIKWG